MTCSARSIAVGLVLSLGGVALSCSPRPSAERPAEPGAGGEGVAAAPASEGDSARIARLEREARALASVEGCGSSAQCRTAPVGNRPCGGPREYLAYCAATTDSAALFRKLDELARAEEEHNRAAGLISTCEFRTPPVPAVVGGRCATSTGVP